MADSAPVIGSRIGAAVDVGSNSVHLLVARLAGEGGPPAVLRDESVLLGLGDYVDRLGRIPKGAVAELGRVLGHYVELSREMGAAHVTLVATEPLRRAENGARVAASVGAVATEPLVILDERAEGELTFLGVTGGRRIFESLLVVDIGGGSSEVVLAEPGARPLVVSLPSGSARLSAGIVEHDPPTAHEIALLRAGARELADGLVRASVARAVFVGGTATNLAHLGPLSRAGIAAAYGTLAALPAARISAEFAVNLRRARQLGPGAALVEALLDHFGLEAAEVSDASLRDGAIVARERLGEDWLARLGEVAELPDA